MKTFRSRISRILAIIAGVLLLVVGIFFLAQPRPVLKFDLADGTHVTISSVQVSSMFHVYSGSSLQQSFFNVIGDRVPARLVGTEALFPASQTNGTGHSLGIILHRFSDNKFIASAWNGTHGLTLVDSNGKETFATQRLVNFETELVNEQTKVSGEQILWELPVPAETNLHFRLYDTNQVSGVVSTNDFFLVKPPPQN